MNEQFGEKVKAIFDSITVLQAKDSDLKRDNANINGDSPMGAMLQYGANTAKEYNLEYLIKPAIAELHRDGWIHIHDLDFYAWTTTCTQIELRKLFKDGFNTGHGHLRAPKSIGSYAALAAIAIQSNQNDQHGGQSVVDFDYAMADGVRYTYQKYLKEGYAICERLNDLKDKAWILDYAMEKTTRDTYQAMEGFIHNLNTMHSRAGAQVPFSSINYGTDTSWEGRLAIEQLLLATEAGLGHGETPIFPIQIFRVKEGINYNPDDPNYDLFKLAMKVSAKRLFPNFAFIDAPFNLQYYKPGHPETEVAYMGCRTRVMGNVYDPSREIAPGRGNLSFTSINLPRLAIVVDGDIPQFFKLLDGMLDKTMQQLLDRYEIQASRVVRNFPFLMGEGVWMDSDKLGPDDEVGEVLKHGTLSMAVYSDDLPDGVDVMFNTNKKKGTPISDVLKKVKDDPDNPFGSLIKAGGQSYYIDADGKRQLSLINKRAEEGDWGEWADKLPSQFLSKQSLSLVNKQLNLAASDKMAEFDEICSLTNPTVKKSLLKSFADDCDSAAVHLQAAALPRQKYQVILPITSMKDNEVYAPNYKNGETVALVRYPHGGTFEIPILTVNNKQAEARRILGNTPKDAIGINSKVAERLSGADFDGDTVMVIPCNSGKSKVKITSTPPLKGLEGFDPKLEYGGKPAGTFKPMYRKH